MKTAGWMIAGFVTAFVSAPRLARAGCENDTQCKGDRICVEGRCVDAAPAKCTRDTDCSGNLVCTAGHCAGPSAPSAPAPAPAAAPASAPAPFVINVGAQQGVQPGPYYAPRALQDWHYRSAGMRRAGIGLFIAGMVLDAVGGILVGTGVAIGCDNDTDCSADAGFVISGATLASIGGAMWITGIPLWVVGGSRLAGPPPLEAMGPSLDVGGVRLSSSGKGLTLQF
jgi:hypothetical protein